VLISSCRPPGEPVWIVETVENLECAWFQCHISCMGELQLQSSLTCPHCGRQAIETMPTDACVAFYDCKQLERSASAGVDSR